MPQDRRTVSQENSHEYGNGFKGAHGHKHGQSLGCEERYEHGYENGSGDHISCSHEGSESHGLLHDAVVYSRAGVVTFGEACSSDDVLAYLCSYLSEIGESFAVNGIIAGHIKAHVICEGGTATLSITRAGVPELQRSEEWNGSRVGEFCKVYLNVLSLTEGCEAVEPLINRVLPWY